VVFLECGCVGYGTSLATFLVSGRGKYIVHEYGCFGYGMSFAFSASPQ